jgi:hypothetical protein
LKHYSNADEEFFAPFLLLSILEPPMIRFLAVLALLICFSAAPAFSGQTVTVTGNVTDTVFGNGPGPNGTLPGSYPANLADLMESNGNSVFLYDTAQVDERVYGGYAESENGSANATGNSVALSDDAKVGINVLGGFAERNNGSAVANSNSVTLGDSAHIDSRVYGGDA